MTISVFVIDHNQTDVKIAGYESLQEATATLCPEGYSRDIVRDRDEMGQLSEDVLLRAYNFKKTGKPKPALGDDRHKVEAALWALLIKKDTSNFSLTSGTEEGNDGGQQPETDSSGEQAQGADSAPATQEGDPSATQEAKVVKKRKSTKKAKAAKAKRKAAAPRKASTGPRGEKTVAIKRLLLRKNGCTRADVLAATGWKAVSMQAMAKNAGLKLTQEKDNDAKGKPTRYYGEEKKSA